MREGYAAVVWVGVSPLLGLAAFHLALSRATTCWGSRRSSSVHCGSKCAIGGCGGTVQSGR
eukprot:4558195-Pyramimonas_sp.AAC.1